MPNALTASAGAAAGTSPPAPAFEAESRDDAALLWIGTGTSTTTGTLCTITFGANYSSVGDPVVPRVSVTFIGLNAANAHLYVSSVTQRQVVIGCTTAPAASQAATSAGGLGVVLTLD